MINVIPINDEREHDRRMDCWCSPRLEWGNERGPYRNGPIIIHNSSDCREAVERLLGEGISENKRWATYEN